MAIVKRVLNLPNFSIDVVAKRVLDLPWSEVGILIFENVIKISFEDFKQVRITG